MKTDLTTKLHEAKQDFKVQLGIISPTEAHRASIKRKVFAGELTPTEALLEYHKHYSAPSKLLGGSPLLRIAETSLPDFESAISAGIETAL
jgi:hypothetical protein